MHEGRICTAVGYYTMRPALLPVIYLKRKTRDKCRNVFFFEVQCSLAYFLFFMLPDCARLPPYQPRVYR